jgi:hypothetical protein
MRKLVVLTAALNCAVAHLVFSDQKIDAPTWQAVEKFDPVALSKTLSDQIGKTIALEFNFRGKDIHHIKPNWYEGSLWQPDTNSRKGFSAVRIIVAKKDLEAFKAITSDATSSRRLTVYGRVEHDAGNNFYFVRLFGRKVAVDSTGNANVTW